MNRAHVPLVYLAIAALFAGCLGPRTTRPTRLFVLNATAASADARAPAAELRLGIGRIVLPERLNRSQIVTRTGTNEVHITDFSQWAEPLEKSIPRVISENLSNLTGTDQISVYPWPMRIETDFKLEIAILAFEGNSDGEVALGARWRWVRADGSEVQPLQASSYAESATDRSTEALVAAMSRALAALSVDIAAAIPSP
ncbi:MAG: membrane integrity-associated transporter subunit PqiC [Deltaproteobacteria bacterium]|jgi:uncharacterized lipoprotein YmbA|nr:membrane integrity-associated transporter subunit PqiC [Deltaproteobacteria bacterium]